MGQLRETTRRNMSLAPRASMGALDRIPRIPRPSTGTTSPPLQAGHSPSNMGGLNHAGRASSGSLPPYIARASTGAARVTNLGNRGSNGSMSSTSLRNLLQVLMHDPESFQPSACEHASHADDRLVQVVRTDKVLPKHAWLISCQVHVVHSRVFCVRITGA